MTLTTRSSLLVTPPLAVTAPETAAVFDRLCAGVGLAYADHLGLLDIRGQDASAFVRAVYGATISGVSGVIRVPHGLMAQLRRDEVILLSPDVHAALEQAVSFNSLLTLTDVTHGRGFIVLAGARAADVLAKVCALNFSDAAFPDYHAAQTMLAKVRALIIRADAAQFPVYDVIVDRSLTAYVWDVLLDSAQQFDGVKLTFDQLKTLGVGAGL